MTLNEQLHASKTHAQRSDSACPVCKPHVAVADVIQSTTKATPQQATAAVAIVMAVAETVRESKRVPSGTVYAALLGRVSFEGYEKILGILKSAELIEETRAHELVWIGPEVRS